MEKQIRVKNKMTYTPSVVDQENGPWKSQTQPDESMSIREIYERYAKNQPLGGSDTNYSDSDQDYVKLDDPDMMELSRMDLADRHEYLETLKESIEQKKKAIEDAKAALLRKEKAKAHVDASIRDFEREVDQEDPKKKVAPKPVKKASEKPSKDEV